MAQTLTHKIWLRPWSSAARLSAAAIAGLVVELLLRQVWSASLSAILAWDAAVICFLGLTYRVIADRSIDFVLCSQVLHHFGLVAPNQTQQCTAAPAS